MCVNKTIYVLTVGKKKVDGEKMLIIAHDNILHTRYCLEENEDEDR